MEEHVDQVEQRICAMSDNEFDADSPERPVISAMKAAFKAAIVKVSKL